MCNGGAEYGTAEGWSGWENMMRGEPGVRRVAARTGEYVFAWRGQSAVVNSELVPVDVLQSYVLSGYFKGRDFAGSVLFGVLMFDEQQRPIKRWNVLPDQQSLTELVAACNVGDKVLQVKDASRWQVGPFWVALFGFQENEPNFNVASHGIDAVRRDGDVWQIVLREPCRMAFPSGTPLVANRSGSHGIFVSGGLTNEWMEMKTIIDAKRLFPGTKYVAVMIQFKSSAKNSGLVLVDDLQLIPYF